jgi:hypothetical protein
VTNACNPQVIPLHRPWFLRWAQWLRPGAAPTRLASPGARDLAVLEHLSAHTLRDIGAPEWVQSRAQERHARSVEPLHRLCDGVHPYGSQGW